MLAEIQRLISKLPWRQWWWPFKRRQPRTTFVHPQQTQPTPFVVQEPAPTPEPAPTVAPPPSTPLVELPLPDIEMNRAMRRKYEKLRKSHDKFVTPQGPEPIHVARGTRKPVDEDDPEHPTEKDEGWPDEDEIAKPIPAIDGPLVPEQLIVDTHHEGGEKVLYEESEFRGEFNFRDTILDQLERYFVYLRRMKRNDRDGYGLYRQLGGHLMPYAATYTWWGYEDEKGKPLDLRLKPEDIKHLKAVLPAAFNKNRPAFGCVAYGTNPLDEQRELEGTFEENGRGKRGMLWIPKFLYFHKYDRPPVGRNIVWQPFPDGDNYRLTVWWDRPHDPSHYHRKYGVPQDFALWISKDGQRIRVLKQKQKHNTWAYPYEFKDWAKSHGVGVQAYLTHVFIMAVEAFENCAMATVRVNVHKDDLTAVFGVDARRLAYFFKDRDVTLNKDGRQHRIFHIIKPHRRKDGALVKMHFRGEREFNWAGYHVQLTVPGLHHAPMEEFDLASRGDPKPGEEMLDGSQLGGMFANYIKTGRLRLNGGSFKPKHLYHTSKEKKED